LQESVRRKKREFEVTAREIEAQIEEQEAEEDRKNREDVRERGGSKNVFQKEGEIQPIDKIYSIPKHHSGKLIFFDHLHSFCPFVIVEHTRETQWPLVYLDFFFFSCPLWTRS
jgi:hypothetical protein